MLVLYLIITCILSVFTMMEEDKYIEVFEDNIVGICLSECVILTILWLLNINAFLIVMNSVLIISTWIDIKCKEIPNVLNIILFLLATLYAVFNGEIVSSLIQLITFITFVIIIHFLINRTGEKEIIGLGDLKLLPSLFVVFNLNGIFYYTLILLIIQLIQFPLLKAKGIKSIPFCPSLCLSFIICIILYPQLILI